MQKLGVFAVRVITCLATIWFRQESQKPSCQNGSVALASQKCLAFAGMNPDFLADGSADFRFDSFNKAPANSVELIGRTDRSGNFQRGLFYPAPAKVRSCVDAFDCVGCFGCFHNWVFCCVADSFNNTTIISGAVSLDCEFCDRIPENIDQNRCCRRRLTQNHADFTRGEVADFQLWRCFCSMFSQRQKSFEFFAVVDSVRHFSIQICICVRVSRQQEAPPTPKSYRDAASPIHRRWRDKPTRAYAAAFGEQWHRRQQKALVAQMNS